jgi:hypothetical protein
MAAARRDWRQGIGEIIGRSGKLVNRDHLDQDRTSQSYPSNQAALITTSDLYHSQRAELYEIAGRKSQALRPEEIMRWMSANNS